MKKIAIFLAGLLMAAVAGAQSESPVSPRHDMLKPMLAPQADAHGIISEQPEGELRQYTRTGGATYATLYFQKTTQDDMLAETVYDDDGETVWFKNILSHAATGTWVMGKIKNGKIEVPLGQMVYWWDSDANGDAYGMRLAMVTVKGSVRNYTVKTTGNAVFAIDGNDLVLEGTSGYDDTDEYVGLGLVYTDAYNNEWSYYLDYETVYHYVEEKAVVPPDDLQTTTYSMQTGNSGHLVGVGFHGDEVYIQGVSETNIPQAWMKGTIEGDKIVFPLQYAGATTSYLTYFSGADVTYDETTGRNVYNWTDGSVTYDYDAATQSFSTSQAVFLTNTKEGFDSGESFIAPSFKPFVEKPATPMDPSFETYYDGYFNIIGYTYVVLNLPTLDADGNFINPDKMAYRFFVDDDEPYPLYTDEYPDLTEVMDELPYNFSDHRYIGAKGTGICIFQTGFDRFGVQTVYRGGGEERVSNIVYYDIVPANLNEVEPQSQPVSTTCYDVSGRRMSRPGHGITLLRTRYADGSERTKKVFNR